MYKIKKLYSKIKYLLTLRRTDVIIAIFQKIAMIGLFIYLCFTAYMLGIGEYTFSTPRIVSLAVLAVIAMVLSWHMYVHQLFSEYEFSRDKNRTEVYDEFCWCTSAH